MNRFPATLPEADSSLTAERDCRIVQVYHELGSDSLIFDQLAGISIHGVREVLSDLQTALDQSDLEELRRLGHALKGSICIWTTGPLFELCCELNSAARSGALDSLRDLLARIQAGWKRIEVKLGRMTRVKEQSASLPGREWK